MCCERIIRHHELPQEKLLSASFLDQRLLFRWRSVLLASECSRTTKRTTSLNYEPASTLLRKHVIKHDSGWLPTAQDREYVRSLMAAVTDPGKIANWIAPPATGTNRQPFNFEYVRL